MRRATQPTQHSHPSTGASGEAFEREKAKVLAAQIHPFGRTTAATPATGLPPNWAGLRASPESNA
jgi:hypothetical protein